MPVDCKPKIKAIADIKKNRLLITISGLVNSKSLDGLYTDIRFCISDLKSEFDVICDISKCNVMCVESFKIYKKIINFFINNNVGQFVKIVDYDNVSYKQMLNYDKNVKGFRSIYIQNVENIDEEINRLQKRNGIRFTLNKILIEYRVNNETGTGYIFDISTSGCAIESPSIPLSIDREICIYMTFEENDDIQSKFEIIAKIVRVNDGVFAAQFLNSDDSCKDRLYKRLAYEAGRPI